MLMLHLLHPQRFPMNQLVRSVHLKLERASAQTIKLDNEAQRWVAANHIRAKCELLKDRLGFRLVQEEFAEPPPFEQWGLLLGECAHNMRSALDNLAYALARLHKDPPMSLARWLRPLAACLSPSSLELENENPSSVVGASCWGRLRVFGGGDEGVELAWLRMRSQVLPPLLELDVDDDVGLASGEFPSKEVGWLAALEMSKVEDLLDVRDFEGLGRRLVSCSWRWSSVMRPLSFCDSDDSSLVVSMYW